MVVKVNFSIEDTIILSLRPLWSRSWGLKLICNHLTGWTQKDVSERFGQLVQNHQGQGDVFVMELVVIYKGPDQSKQFVTIVTRDCVLVVPCLVAQGEYCVHPGLKKLTLYYREDLALGISQPLWYKFLMQNMAPSLVKVIGEDLDDMIAKVNINFHSYQFDGNHLQRGKLDILRESQKDVQNVTRFDETVPVDGKLRRKGAKPKSLGGGVGISKRRSPYLRFSVEEDAILMELSARNIQKHKSKDNKPQWSELVEDFLATDPHKHADKWEEKERNSVLRKMIRERYIYHLSPSISKKEFSPEEDLTVAAMYSVWGTKWSWMVKHIQGRTDNQIKNRWHFCVKKKFLDGNYDPLVVEVEVKGDVFLVAVTKDSLVTVPCLKNNNCTDNHFLPVLRVDEEEKVVAASGRRVALEMKYCSGAAEAAEAAIQKKINPSTGYTLWRLGFRVEEQVMVIPGEVREKMDGGVGRSLGNSGLSQTNQYKLMAQEKMIMDRKKELMDERNSGQGKRKRYNLASQA